MSEEDVREVAKEFARMQMQQYGLANLPDEHLNGFVDKILESEKERKNIVDRASEVKIMQHIKGAVKLDEKEVEVEEFNKMFE